MEKKFWETEPMIEVFGEFDDDEIIVDFDENGNTILTTFAEIKRKGE